MDLDPFDSLAPRLQSASSPRVRSRLANVWAHVRVLMRTAAIPV